MNVLITGGYGYIGSAIERNLHARGIRTVVYDDCSCNSSFNKPRGQAYQGKFSKGILRNIFDTEQIDAVIHCAAFASVPDSVIHPDKYYRNNVTNMQMLLDFCREYEIKYFVFSSSAATFGEPKYVPIDEAHPQEPINPYGFTKLIGEHLLKDYKRAYGINYCIFRYFCAAGDEPYCEVGERHDPETHLIPVTINAAINGTTMNVCGTDYPTKDGTGVRDYIHVMDLAEAHYLGLKYIMDNDISDDFNLGNNVGYSVMEIIKKVEEVTGKEVKYQLTDRRPGDPAILVASNEKAKRVLGWNPIHSSLDEIIHSAYKWHKFLKDLGL